MSILSFNPTTLAESIVESNQDDGVLIMTGILDLSKVSVYGAIIDNLDSDAIRYGYVLSDDCVIIDVENLPDYVEELTNSLIELTGIAELDLTPLKEFSDDDAAIPKKYYAKGISELKSLDDEEDSSDEDEEETLPDDFSVEEIIPEHIYECLNSCQKVLTGSHIDISTNTITV